ncbi:histidine phosphatase family protein [Paraclostridium sordellii]|uniref:histidine phosphatase family protein n=1 Tax=Paraclostridium sordellii TaxID=1505 RepID=UPI000386E4A9|nr:histidine phosphatase family protein [Paeniclostridium sordellii]EPZ58100.1 histidine phosphatase super family protein [[Clostridium] sordellii VPI 9048] [Paeniclostridium sordellii VPI 9048]MDU2146862.1 histidine phosphatase family protein [Paeniclostridium sordellii]CEK37337.1 phosphoglycerate mutase family protein [[Clostridium] sordellii] [Paeniclostridium sordellii]CEN76133.1 phosphoglycerate mutase [[Clostridium] sordellii] [Paeniclostridium sordellii]CEQ22030.1 phosphoglycerate mutas
MNKIYFVRHAKPDFSVHDDLTRPLTDKGIIDSKNICEFLKEKSINKIYSSPYKRAIDTIKELAQNLSIKIEVVDDFRERKISNIWIEDFNKFSKSQWENFEYKLNDGESLNEVQSRNIKALHKILNENSNQNIVIGTHGTALSTIINYYDKTFDYLSFTKIKDVMPFIVCMEFEKTNVLNIDYILEDSDSILSLN